jgi:3-oxoacyl-[acyl-carrier protein] reductase
MRILIAGATSGIGLAAAEALAADGHEVWGCGRRAMERDLYADHQSGGRLLFRQVDVRDEEQVQALCGELRTAKASHLDALIVAAGVFGAIGRVAFSDSHEFRTAFETNVLGCYYLAKHGYRLLTAAAEGRPRMIAFAGGGAFNPFPHYAAYAASKAAVVRLVECLAVEWAGHVSVNAIAPGMVNTAIHEQTMAAGPYRAGKVQFARTIELQDAGGVPLDVPVGCLRWLLAKETAGITGRTIAANFDPWPRPEFLERLVLDPDLCTTERRTIHTQGG